MIPIKKGSLDAIKDWNIPIEILFIDGAHEYEAVEKDFLLWSKYLIDGGIIVLHDTTACLRTLLLQGCHGPKKVAEKYIFSSQNFKDVGLVDTITYAKKCKSNTFQDRARMRGLRYYKIIPDLKHYLYCGVLDVFLPQKLKFALKRFLKKFVKFI